MYLMFSFRWKDHTADERNSQIKNGVMSRLVKFKGEPSFRAALTPGLFLYLMTLNMNKIGVQVVNVIKIQHEELDEETTQMLNLTEEDKTGCLQIFKSDMVLIAGDEDFEFFLYTNGNTKTYEIIRMDTMLKEQLWLSTVNKMGTDYEIIAFGKTFSVHKFILASRSQVFAALFQDDKDCSQKLETSVESTTMEQFLKFIYTGELERAIISCDDLKYLAETYQIKSLEDLCDAASHDIDATKMAFCASILTKDADGVPFQTMADEGEPEVDLSASVRVIELVWDLKVKWTEGRATFLLNKPTKTFQVTVGNESLIFVASASFYNDEDDFELLAISFSSFDLARINCYSIKQVRFNTNRSCEEPKKMGEIPVNNESSPIQIKFCRDEAIDTTEEQDPSNLTITFLVHLATTIPNYNHTFLDSTWKDQLWNAALSGDFTDAEINVGGKSFAAHRFILSARSPVFSAMFSSANSGMLEAETGKVSITERVDPNDFAFFLQFLYTGILPSTAKKTKLFPLADKYQVETLKDLCNPAGTLLDPHDISKDLFSNLE